MIRTFDLETGADLGVFIDLSRKVNSAEDRGLLDIALHPNFPAQPYLYAFYVVDPPELAASELDQNLNRYSHLVRITADVSEGHLRAVPGSEVVLLGTTGKSLDDIGGGGLVNYFRPIYSGEPSSEQTLNPDNPVPVVDGFKQDYLKVDAQTHAGGALAFGPDGMLYVSTGDGASPNYADPRSPHVQKLDSLAGKILRIDPMTGDGLADNPFYEPGMSLDLNRAKVWQYGLRNPFSIGFADDGRLFITDTGWNSFEEINAGLPGANFGWPWFEGAGGGVLNRTPGYRDFAAAAAFYQAVSNGTVVVTPAFAAFGHATEAPGFVNQAITGGSAIYDGGRYPAAFADDYFFADFTSGNMFTVDIDNRTDIQFLANSDGVFAPVHFMNGPDGYVYFVELGGRRNFDNDGVIGKLLISEKGPPPPPDGDNLLVNGSFEQPLVASGSFERFDAVTGWRAIAGGQIEIWRGFKGAVATDGVNVAEIDAGTALDGLFQDVRTQAGASYALTFDAAVRPGGFASTSGFEVLWNNALVATVRPTRDWDDFAFTVRGTGGTDRLLFRELAGESGNAAGALIDDVRLSGTEAPPTSPDAPPPVGAELLVNGSFEQPSVASGSFERFDAVTGWRAIAGGQIEIWRGFKGAVATDGVNVAEIDAGTALDGLFQDVRTQAGASYDLTFDAAVRPGGFASTSGFEVLWNNALVATVRPTRAWDDFAFTVLGTGGTDRLLFRELAGESGNAAGALIDDVSLIGTTTADSLV